MFEKCKSKFKNFLKKKRIGALMKCRNDAVRSLEYFKNYLRIYGDTYEEDWSKLSHIEKELDQVLAKMSILETRIERIKGEVENESD